MSCIGGRGDAACACCSSMRSRCLNAVQLIAYLTHVLSAGSTVLGSIEVAGATVVDLREARMSVG